MTLFNTLSRALPFALLAAASPAAAQDAGVTYSDELASFQYGIMCFYDDTAPGVPLSFPRVREMFDASERFDDVRVSQTLVVPALPDLVIGVVSDLAQGVTFDVTSIITHTNLAGLAVEDEATLTFDSFFEVDSWMMDASQPSQQGSYRFQVLRGKTTIYDVTFTIVPVASYTGPYPDCVTRR